MDKRLVPDDFDVLAGVETERYRPRMLTVDDVDKYTKR